MTSAGEEEIRYLRSLAVRLQDDPRFMAHTLSRYQKERGLDEEGLAREMKTLPEMLVRLALCKKPSRTLGSYEEQITDLASFTLLEEGDIKRLIERAESEPQGFEESLRHPIIGPLVRVKRAVGGMRNRFVDLCRFPRPALTRLGLATFICLLTISALAWLRRGQESPAPAALVSSAEDGAKLVEPEPRVPGRNNGDTAADETEPDASVTAANPAAPARVEKRRAGSSNRPDIKVDLEHYAVLRGPSPGEKTATGQAEVIRLPRADRRVLFHLPEGSRPGQYRVSIRDGADRIVTSNTWSSENGKAVVALLNLRALAPKRYRLCVYREGDVPYCYPLTIADN